MVSGAALKSEGVVLNAVGFNSVLGLTIKAIAIVVFNIGTV